MRNPSQVVAVVFGAFVVSAACAPGAHGQDSGSTLSPDLQSYMVNKDLGNERWTINLNLYSTNPDSIINITGNIFRTEGGAPSFVACLVREDSTGTLRNAESTFRLSCMGTDACATTAESCAREDWRPIDDDVLVPASFFLPPDGIAQGQGVASRARVESFLGDLIDRLSSALASLRGYQATRSAHAQSEVRGATLSYDRMNYLVTKDVGTERWSISYNLWPVVTGRGGVVSQFLSVTGNVYQPDGSPPSFVYCTQNPDSTGTLDDPSSEYAFTCVGTDACATSAIACAENEWRPISDDVRLEASFFLPPGGLPAPPQSDPEILVLGDASGPPAIVAAEFTTEAEAAAGDRPAGGCPEGATCFVPTLGTCDAIEGTVVLLGGFGCGCSIDPVPPECIACAGGASSACGSDCEYGVGGSTARGTCLPFDSGVDACICYAIQDGEPQSVQGCGGPVAVPCRDDRCCANDPRGSCDPLGGEIPCPGVCVAAHGCDPEVEQCGICLSPPGVPTPTPVVPTPTPGEPTPTPGEPTPTPVEPTPGATATTAGP